MIVDELELIGRLGEVEPLPEESFEQARTLLQAAVALDATPEPAPARTRRRLRRRRAVAVQGGLGVGIAAAAAAVVLIAPSTTPPAPPSHAVSSPRTTAAPSSSHAATTPLMRLADYIQANATAPQPGDATLVLRTQSYPNGTSTTGADLYADNGEYFYAMTESGLPAAIAENADVGGGVPAREIKAAEDAANGSLATARQEMANAPFADGVPPSGPADPAAFEQKVEADPNIPAAQKAALEKKLGAEQSTPVDQQAHTDNYIWMDSLDTLSEGAGNPEVRTGVLRILSTLSEVSVTDTTTDGQPTLTLTATAPALPTNYQEALTINATTGVPVSFAGGVPGQTPSVTITYQVSRATLADIAAGKF
jgi:hypothetical protein